MKLSRYGADVYHNVNTWSGKAGSIQPDTCAGCRSEDRMSYSRLDDGRQYWVCDLCGCVHESDKTQGTANGISAFPNKFRVGAFVRRRGDWLVYRVKEAYGSSKPGEGFFRGVLVVDGAKYHKLGETIFEDASRYEIEPNPKGFIESHGDRFIPDASAKD